ncbi:protein kinase domain-containing protein [Haematococcus lacustris]|uniref:Protein kinase domain-containing protein n=1 Tax=Haematococcus lacustris TaxID=44745 RepID=A0A6A0A562_HAELA|nr:protein kinase domain-containing protein [Haematococcus lacustris]
MLRMTCSPLEVLHDLQLLSLIGSGGFAAVFAGLWRGNGDVAVKLCVTNATEEGRLPGRAITEAILSKGLAHPSLIQTWANGLRQLSYANLLCATSINE